MTMMKKFLKTFIKIFKKFEIPIIATQEVFYLSKDMYEAHDALTCIGEKSFIDDKKDLDIATNIF